MESNHPSSRSERDVQPLNCPGINWCRQDGIEPPSARYKLAVLPLNDAGVGVDAGCWPRTCAFTERRADRYTTPTVSLEKRRGVEPRDARLQLATQSRRIRASSWQEWKELNPRPRSWRPLCYHNTSLPETGSPSRYRPWRTRFNRPARSLARVMGNGAGCRNRTEPHWFGRPAQSPNCKSRKLVPSRRIERRSSALQADAMTTLARSAWLRRT